MNNPDTMRHSLARLISLREREVERHQAQLANKQQLRDRQASALERLEMLSRQVQPAALTTATLSSNSAAYKQAVLQWADQQRQDLALHDADMAVQRQQMLAVARQQEAYAQLLGRVDLRLQTEQGRLQQKQQDDLAGQVWLRRRA